MSGPKIINVGSTTTSSGTASVGAALPTLDGSVACKLVRVVSPTVVYLKFGYATTVAATANDIRVTSVPQILNVQGMSHFSVIQDAVTTAGKLNITPVASY